MSPKLHAEPKSNLTEEGSGSAMGRLQPPTPSMQTRSALAAPDETQYNESVERMRKEEYPNMNQGMVSLDLLHIAMQRDVPC